MGNWIQSSPKKGIRFDGSGEPVCHEKSGCGGYVGFNVVWNSEDKEIYPKGDNHTVVNNVAWDDINTDKCSLCVPSEHQGVEMNYESIVVNNGASMFEGGGGVIENNYESNNVKQQMMDTDNYDFRPVVGGAFITPDGGDIIGAYTSGESSLIYWIPGRKLYKTSFPIPQDGVMVSAERTDVICRTGYVADHHDFYFGETFEGVDSAGKEDDAFVMTLSGDENVFTVPSLVSGKIYYWRVDAGRGNDIYKGDVWSFETV